MDQQLALKLSKKLFWDVNPETIDADKHALFIVERVLTRGSWDEFQKIITWYGKGKIASYACQIRYLDKKTLSFCSSYFNIAKESFRCYAQQQLNQTHWNY